MALEKIRPRVVDATGNYTFNDVNLTGNVSSPTANIGNLTGVNNLVASSNTITVTGNLSTTANITAGNIKTNTLLYANGSPWPIGASATVAGINSQVQFNDASSFGASANFTFDKTSNTLTVTNLNTNGSGITNITGSSVTGQVPNALIAATVYTNSQPNITSVGTLSSLTVTGSINSGNADLGNTATANYFVGSGNNLSNIQGSNITGAVSYATTANSVSGSNVSGAVTYAATANAVAGANVLGQVGNSLVAGTVYTNAQPNITSVGTLTSLGVTGNITSGNANLGNAVTANHFIGNGSQLTGIIASSSANANYANYAGNAFSVTGSNVSGQVANALVAGTVYTNAQPNITSVGTLSNLSVTGNIAVGAIVTGIGSGGNISNANVISANTFTASGNITGGNANLGNAVIANYFVGNGSLLTGIVAASANYIANGNSNVNIASSNGNITVSVTGVSNTAVFSNLGVNVAGYLTVNGNITAGNANLGNAVTANYFVGNGSQLTGVSTGSIANGNSNVNIPSANGNINISAVGNANVLVITGTGANITGALTVSGDATVGNIVTGNGTGGNITGANILSANTLTASGNLTAGNANLGNLATANFFTGNGSALSALTFGNITTFSTAGLTTDELYLQSTTRLNVTASGASGYLFDQYGATVNPAIYVTSGQTIAFNLNVPGHPFLIQTSGSANYSIGLEHVSTIGTVLTTTSAQGQILGTLYWKVPYGITGNYKYQCSAHGGMNGNIVVSDANVANINVANATVAGTVYTAAQPNITSVGTLSNLTVTGNTTLSGANVTLGAVANLHITGGSNGYVLQTDGSGTLSWAAQSGGSLSNISNGNSNVNIPSANGDINFSAVGNANVVVITGTGANITGTANISGNLTAGNISGANTVTANYFTGNLYGTANLAVYATTANNVAGANVSGQVANATVASTVYTNAQPNITSVGTLSSLTVSGITTLGNIGNVKISGGSANFTLQTDGLGNLSWAVPAVTSVGDVTINNFTGNGSQTAYTLSVNPGNIKYVSVNIDGVLQLRQVYSVSGTTLTFVAAPVNGALIEVTTITSGQVTYATTASTVTASAQPNITSVGTLANLSISGNITGNLLPSANITYDLGSSTQRWKDLYLSNSTIYLGDTPFSTANVFPFNLSIAPEVLTIQVAAPDAGDDTTWLWTWETSTLPYARTAITNSPQVNVPMYKQGTYVLNNFAGNQIFGNMTQTHDGYFKWIDGAGTQNLVNWAVNNGNFNVTHPNINGGASTSVERYTITVPSTVTPPTLNTPSANYAVSFVSMGAYTIGENQAAGIDHHDSAANGPNKNLGPLYRGGTYTFNLHSSIASHPFYLTTDNGSGFVANSYVGEYTSGVVGSRNNGTTGKTTLVFTVPNNAPDTLYYQCGLHSAMRGTITIKNLAVETNINGNYVIYFQHTGEGHKTPIEIRPIPSLVNQMCVVYDASVGKFVPQDMATYVENTPSFKNKIREVAGTATLVAGNDVVVVPSVSIVEDASYLPFVGNKNGDISYAEDSDTIYLWNGSQWRNTKSTAATPVYVNLNMPGSITAPFTGVARYYPINTILITTVYANLGTAPSGNFTFLIKKNGVSIGTTFTMSGVVMTPVSVNVSLTTSDYLTLDITGVNGSDLSIKLKYTY